MPDTGRRGERRIRVSAWTLWAWGTLAVGRILAPDPMGWGTPAAWGVPACPSRTWLGCPCPLCGATTAVRALARGQLLDALQAHAPVALLTVGFAVAPVAVALDRASPASPWARIRRRAREPSEGAKFAFVAGSFLIWWALHVV